MSSSIKGIWEAVWGLVVEDGSLAVGIAVALTLTWLAVSTGREDLVAWAGWGLLAMLLVLVVVNLYQAGRRASLAVVASRTSETRKSHASQS